MARSRPNAPAVFTARPSADLAEMPVECVIVSDDEVPSGIVVRAEMLASAPRLAVSTTELTAMPLDHRAGFILSFVDGVYTVEMILDACAMRRQDALAILCELVDRGVIVLDGSWLAPP